jgi:hypothetical protein
LGFPPFGNLNKAGKPSDQIENFIKSGIVNGRNPKIRNQTFLHNIHTCEIILVAAYRVIPIFAAIA